MSRGDEANRGGEGREAENEEFHWGRLLRGTAASPPAPERLEEQASLRGSAREPESSNPRSGSSRPAKSNGHSSDLSHGSRDPQRTFAAFAGHRSLRDLRAAFQLGRKKNANLQNEIKNLKTQTGDLVRQNVELDAQKKADAELFEIRIESLEKSNQRLQQSSKVPIDPTKDDTSPAQGVEEKQQQQAQGDEDVEEEEDDEDVEETFESLRKRATRYKARIAEISSELTHSKAELASTQQVLRETHKQMLKTEKALDVEIQKGKQLRDQVDIYRYETNIQNPVQREQSPEHQQRTTKEAESRDDRPPPLRSRHGKLLKSGSRKDLASEDDNVASESSSGRQNIEEQEEYRREEEGEEREDEEQEEGEAYFQGQRYSKNHYELVPRQDHDALITELMHYQAMESIFGWGIPAHDALIGAAEASQQSLERENADIDAILRADDVWHPYTIARAYKPDRDDDFEEAIPEAQQQKERWQRERGAIETGQGANLALELSAANRQTMLPERAELEASIRATQSTLDNLQRELYETEEECTEKIRRNTERLAVIGDELRLANEASDFSTKATLETERSELQSLVDQQNETARQRRTETGKNRDRVREEQERLIDQLERLNRVSSPRAGALEPTSTRGSTMPTTGENDKLQPSTETAESRREVLEAMQEDKQRDVAKLGATLRDEKATRQVYDSLDPMYETGRTEDVEATIQSLEKSIVNKQAAAVEAPRRVENYRAQQDKHYRAIIDAVRRISGDLEGQRIGPLVDAVRREEQALKTSRQSEMSDELKARIRGLSPELAEAVNALNASKIEHAQTLHFLRQELAEEHRSSRALAELQEKMARLSHEIDKNQKEQENIWSRISGVQRMETSFGQVQAQREAAERNFDQTVRERDAIMQKLSELQDGMAKLQQQHDDEALSPGHKGRTDTHELASLKREVLHLQGERDNKSEQIASLQELLKDLAQAQMGETPRGHSSKKGDAGDDMEGDRKSDKKDEAEVAEALSDMKEMQWQRAEKERELRRQLENCISDCRTELGIKNQTIRDLEAEHRLAEEHCQQEKNRLRRKTYELENLKTMAEEELARGKADLETRKKEVSYLHDELLHLQSQLQQKEHELTRGRERQAEGSSGDHGDEIAKLEAENERLRSQVEAAKAELETKQRELNERARVLEIQLDDQITNAQEEQRGLQNRIEDLQRASREAAETLQREFDEAKAKHQKMQDEQQQKLDQSQKDIIAKSEEVDELRGQVQGLQSALITAETRLAEAARNAAGPVELEELEILQMEYKDLEEQFEDAQANCEQQKVELRELLEDSRAENKALSQELNELEAKMQRTKSQLEIKDQMLQNETMRANNAEARAAPAGDFPLSKQIKNDQFTRDMQTQFENLQKQLGEALEKERELKTALYQAKAAEQAAVESEKGQKKFSDLHLRLGIKAKEEMNAKRLEVTKLTKSVKTLEGERDDLKQKLESALEKAKLIDTLPSDEERRQVQEQMDQARRERENLYGEVRELQEKVEEHKQGLNARKTIEYLKEQIQTLEAQVAESHPASRVEELKKALKAAKSENVKMTVRLANRQNAPDDEAPHLSRRSESLQAELRKAQDEAQKLKNEIDLVKLSERRNAAKHQQQLQAQVDELKKTNAQLGTELSSAATGDGGLRVDENVAKMKALGEEIAKLEESIRKKEEEAEAKGTEPDTFDERAAINNLKMERGSLEATVGRDNPKMLMDQIGQLQQEIRDLRAQDKRRRNLQSVTINEYKAEQKAHAEARAEQQEAADRASNAEERLQAKSEELLKTQHQLDKCQNTHAVLTREAEMRAAEMAKLREECERKSASDQPTSPTNDLEGLRKENEELRKKIVKNEAQIQGLTRERDEKAAALALTHVKLDEARGLNTACNEALRRTGAKLKEAEDDLQATPGDANFARTKKLVIERIGQLQRELTEAQEELADTERTLRETSEALIEAGSALEEAEERQRKLQSELEETKKLQKAAEELLREKKKTMENLERKLSESAKEGAEQRERVKSFRDETFHAKRAVGNYAEKCVILNQDIADGKQVIERLQKEYQEARERNSKVEDMAKTIEGLQEQLESAMAKQNEANETESAAQAGMQLRLDEAKAEQEKRCEQRLEELAAREGRDKQALRDSLATAEKEAQRLKKEHASLLQSQKAQQDKAGKKRHAFDPRPAGAWAYAQGVGVSTGEAVGITLGAWQSVLLQLFTLLIKAMLPVVWPFALIWFCYLAMTGQRPSHDMLRLPRVPWLSMPPWYPVIVAIQAATLLLLYQSWVKQALATELAELWLDSNRSTRAYYQETQIEGVPRWLWSSWVDERFAGVVNKVQRHA